MVVTLLYEMQSPCNCFTLSLCVAIVVEVIVGETTTTLRWRSRCQAGDEVIMTVFWRWRSKAQDDDGHIISLILIACDVYPLCILFCLVRW